MESKLLSEHLETQTLIQPKREFKLQMEVFIFGVIILSLSFKLLLL